MRRCRVVALLVAVVSSVLVTSGTAASAVAPVADTNHVLVRFAASVPASGRALSVQSAGGRIQSRLNSLGIDVVEVPANSVDRVVAALKSLGGVEFAEPNYLMTVGATPNDTFYPGNASVTADLWGLKNNGQFSGTAGADIKAPQAWDAAGIGGTGVWPVADFTVGVVDTGVDATHPDLAGKIVASCSSALTGTGTLLDGCLDGNGHGTHVSGTIAAVGDNGLGIVGVAPNAKVLPCKALDDTGSGWTSDIAACVDRLVSFRDSLKLRVISMSLGGPSSSTMQAAVDRAWNAGVVVVAAAGNDGNTSLSYPASYANAISVGATDRNDTKATFSNYNSKVEIAAPGVAIVSTTPGGNYGSWNGTSMATPHVAAAAALIYWKTGQTGQALRTALDAAVDDLGAAGRDTSFGFGRLNLCKAMGSCSATPTPTPTPSPTPAPTASPTPAPTSTVSGPGTLKGTAYRSGTTRSSVLVKWSGSASGSIKTGSAGTYSSSLNPGSYTVTATYSRRTCRAGSSTGPTSAPASVTSQSTTTINWYC